MSLIKYIIPLIFILTINCGGNKVSNYHGVKKLETKYSILQVNVTNKNDLINIIGPPSSISDFNKNKWFYIERLKSNQSLLKYLIKSKSAISQKILILILFYKFLVISSVIFFASANNIKVFSL